MKKLQTLATVALAISPSLVMAQPSESLQTIPEDIDIYLTEISADHLRARFGRGFYDFAYNNSTDTTTSCMSHWTEESPIAIPDGDSYDVVMVDRRVSDSRLTYVINKDNTEIAGQSIRGSSEEKGPYRMNAGFVNYIGGRHIAEEQPEKSLRFCPERPTEVSEFSANKLFAAWIYNNRDILP